MGCGEFWTQLKVLCWKNRTLKLRHWSTLLLELSLPTIVLLALWGIMNVTKPSIIAESTPSNFDLKNVNKISQIGKTLPCFPNYMNLLWNCPKDMKGPCPSYGNLASEEEGILLGCARSYIAVAPVNANSGPAAHEFYSWASNVSNVNYNGNLTSDGNLTSEAFKYFNSESELISLVTGKSYGIDPSASVISAGIIFISGAPNWEYTLRFNSSNVPDTKTIDVDDSVSYFFKFNFILF
jgi:hypothetical protein